MKIYKCLQGVIGSLVCLLAMSDAAQSANYTVNAVARLGGTSTYLPPDNTEFRGVVFTSSYMLQPSSNPNVFSVGLNVPADGAQPSNLAPMGDFEDVEWFYYVANRGPNLNPGLQCFAQTSSGSVHIATVTDARTRLVGTSRFGVNIYSVVLGPRDFDPPIPTGGRIRTPLRRLVLRYRGNQPFRLTAPDILGTEGRFAHDKFRYRTDSGTTFSIINAN